MQKSIFFIMVFALIAALTSCSKSATCECTTEEVLNADGSVISSSKETYQSAGNDPTCNDFEDTFTTDSSTVTTTCVSI
jgi:hypothetical protein